MRVTLDWSRRPAFPSSVWRLSCVDKDVDKIARLNRGELPIFEPGLADLVSSNFDAGRLRFTSDLKSAVTAANAVLLLSARQVDAATVMPISAAFMRQRRRLRPTSTAM